MAHLMFLGKKLVKFFSRIFEQNFVTKTASSPLAKNPLKTAL
jgi:hypothetical protein